MYQIVNGDKIIAAERLVFVKKQRNGNIVVCPENEAMGIVTESDEGFYNLASSGGLGEYPAVTVKKIDSTEKINQNFMILFEAIADIFEAIESEGD